MSDLLDQPTSTISEAIDESRTLANKWARLAFNLRFFAEPGAVAPKDPNLPHRVAKAVADLSNALGDASIFSAVEHWFTCPEPVEFAGVHAGSVHRVALKLARGIQEAAAQAIELVHNEATVRRLQKLPECRWRWENNDRTTRVRVRSWEYSPFVVTCQTSSLDILEAWHLETWDAIRAALIQQPLFDDQHLQAMIDCEWGRVKQRFETRSHEADRSRPDESSCDSGTNGVDSVTATAVVITSNWRDPVIIRGKPKRLTFTQWKLIRALFDAGKEGMSKREIETKVPSARAIIRELGRKDKDWEDVLRPAGKKGGRYCLIA